VTSEVFVVGFPFYVHEGLKGAATWTRGSIATEPTLNYEDLPCMLLDARTRQGQSGSPVVHHRKIGIPVQQEGPFYISRDELLGVYSGRVNDESDLGFMWRPDAIREVIDGQKRATNQSLIPIGNDESGS